MKAMILVLISLILSSCGNEVFSPTYSETVCVPAQELGLEFLDEVQNSQYATDNTPQSCCENSGLVSCCFGGNYVCADGQTGVGCGCPTN